MKSTSLGFQNSYRSFVDAFRILILIVIVPLFHAHSYADHVKISGTLTILGARTERMGFTCEPRGCSWIINTFATSLENANELSGERPRFHRVTSDGTNTYWLTIHSTNVFNNIRSNYTNSINVQQVGKITKGAFPVMVANVYQAPTQVAPIWFAFCSACYLDSLKGDRMEPVWTVHQSMAGDPEVFPRVQIQRSSQPPYLPIESTFFSTGLTKSGNGEGKIRAVRRKPPFNNGFKQAEFKSTGLTNFNGSTFVLNASLTTYGPDSGATTKPAVHPLITWDIKVTGLEVVPDDLSELHPEAPHLANNMIAVVSDERMPRNTNATSSYTTTNGWISETDKRFEELSHRMLREKGPPREARRTLLEVLFITFTFIVISIAIFICAKVLRNKK